MHRTVKSTTLPLNASAEWALLTTCTRTERQMRSPLPLWEHWQLALIRKFKHNGTPRLVLYKVFRLDQVRHKFEQLEYCQPAMGYKPSVQEHRFM